MSELVHREGLQIGCRIRDDDGYKGTVRYIGPVQSTASNSTDSNWLGIEWDDHSRGKHGGTTVDKNGKIIRYFTCPDGAGSFVKIHKVKFGRSFIEALQERYTCSDEAEGNPLIDRSTVSDAFVNTSKGNQKSIEFVGGHKIRSRQQLKSLTSVSVRNEDVSYVGDNFEGFAGHLKEVDLQDNLIWQWSEIAKIGSACSELSKLLLHGNKMQAITTTVLNELPSGCFTNLRVLALNGCNLNSWSAIQSLERFLPAIEELYLANNDLSDLPVVADDEETSETRAEGFTHLRVLDISYCQLISWQQVLYFGALPALQELVLDNNRGIGEIRPATLSDGQILFQRLTRISLSSTGLSSWSDIDNLVQFSNINTLRISQIPLFTGKGASEIRPLVIARVPQLEVVNGSKISERERRDAEKLYLRSILREIQQHHTKDVHDQSVQSVIALLHPRFAELDAKYRDELDAYYTRASEQQSTESSSKESASELITVVLRNFSFSGNGTLEPITKKLPKSTTIGRLRLLVKQLFKLELHLQQLSVRIYKDSVPFVLDDDSLSLQYYGILDNSEIFINESKE